MIIDNVIYMLAPVNRSIGQNESLIRITSQQKDLLDNIANIHISEDYGRYYLINEIKYLLLTYKRHTGPDI